MSRISEILQINFGVFSPEEIIKNSVCEVTSNKLSGINSIYDERMGTMENQKNCLTCGQNYKNCPGHFGRIKLNLEFIHPLYYRIVLIFLKCFCNNCSTLLITEEKLKLLDLIKYKGELRVAQILTFAEKIDVCYNCNTPQPRFLFSTTENMINVVHKVGKESVRTQLSDSDVKKIFENISNEDISLIGLNPDFTHPKNLLLSYLPVLPPVARPYIIADGITCDDDLTLQYLEIIKSNNHLGNRELDESKRQKHIQSLKFRVKCLFDNSQEKAKLTNGRPMKGIKKRLAGKEGVIRNNLMGKRVNKSARTVIGPDPTLRLGEIAIPKKIASILSYPVRVNILNINELTDLVNNDKANCILRDNGKTRINLKYALYRKGNEILDGDKIIRDGLEMVVSAKHFRAIPGDIILRNGKQVLAMKKKNFELKLGDIVERKLKDGDIVLLNRQPTLHKGSMLAQNIKIMDCKTIRMNLAITKTFNADFDGDEMNIHVPNGPESEAELRLLSATKWNIMSAQSSKPNIAIVQDSLLGAFLMTDSSTQMKKGTFYQIAIYGDNWKPDFINKKIFHIRRVLKAFGKKAASFTGKGLFSLLLPDDFNFEKKNNASEKEPIVKIYRGVLYEGSVNKSITGSIIQTLLKEYSKDVSVDFINNIQFISNQWLMWNSFSVGISDCIATKSSQINAVVSKCFMEATTIEQTTQNPNIREMKVNAALSKARDHGMRIAKEALTGENNFISTVTAGSKGDYFNIAQITGLLGQQNLTGRRIPATLNKNKRTLPHYPFEITNEEEKFESRGFIKSSFIKGLNPKEFWFHAMTGREGITDTAMKTANTGYTQRKMVKLLEDLQVKYDGSVRNSKGDIIQLQYGEDGLDGAKTVILNNNPSICDINRLANCLNTQFEVKNKINKSKN